LIAPDPAIEWLADLGGPISDFPRIGDAVERAYYLSSVFGHPR